MMFDATARGSPAEGALKQVYGWAGIAAALVLLGVSVVMNYRFGASLGKTEFDGQIYGFASAAADCLKALAPFFLFAAWRNRLWSATAIILVLWTVMTVYSMTSALGHAALNRLSTAAKRTTEATNYADLRKDLARAEQDLGWITQHRPAEQVRADLEGHKAQRTWVASNECTDPAGKAAREYCQTYHRLSGELAAAEKADKLEARIAEIKGKLDGRQVVSEEAADPQASVLARISRMSIDTVQAALTIFVALLIEIGSNFGLYAATSYLRRDRDVVLDLPFENGPKASAWQDAQALSATRDAPERALLPAPETGGQAPGPTLTTADVTPALPCPPAAGTSAVATAGPAGSADTPAPASIPRIVQTPSEAARGFFEWCRRTGRAGRQYFDQDLREAYASYCTGENCEPVRFDDFRAALGSLNRKQVKKDRVWVKASGQKLTCWTITQGRPKPAEEPAREGTVLQFAAPLAAAGAEPAREEGGSRSRGMILPLRTQRSYRFLPEASPHVALRQLAAHEQRRCGRHIARKQRGPLRRTA